MKRNHRLRFAFQLCKDLGIDDPVCWFNAAPPQVVDAWMAYYILINESVSEEKEMMSPDQVRQRLEQRHG